jgi:methanogenic corrinoid protein MtbC1
MVNLSDISKSLQSGKAGETSDLIAKAFKEHYSVESILKQGLIPGMSAVTYRYKRKEICQPELLVAARAMNMGIRTLRPLIASSAGKPKGTVIIGTVKGDIQDIEKNLMAVTMEGIGLRVIDLGTGISPERFVEAAIAEKARIVLCIASLPATMGQLKLVVLAAAASGIRNRVKIIISGAPVTEKYCRTIGADHYAQDTVGAAEMAGLLCGGER